MYFGLHKMSRIFCHLSVFQHFRAILAQLVEHLIRNQEVGGSNPLDGSTKKGFVSLRHKPFLLPSGVAYHTLPTAITASRILEKK